jgi:hypothetical protein
MTAGAALVAAVLLTVRPDMRTTGVLTFLAVMAVMAIAQTIYNYRRWQAELRSNDTTDT